MTQFTQCNLKREVCGTCLKQIFVGQAVTICKQCDIIVHGKCGTKNNVMCLNEGNTYCNKCIERNNIIRYNPFLNLCENEDSDKFYDGEPTELTESMGQVSKILESCSMYNSANFNKMVILSFFVHLF